MNLKERIDELVDKYGTMRQVAYRTHVDIGYLHHLRKGTKTNPSNEVCTLLDLEKRMVIKYTRLTKDNQEE